MHRYRIIGMRGSSDRGQSLAEFALVFPLLFLLVAAIIQFGMLFWAQNTLTQIARDTGRWAATQQKDCTPGAADPALVTDVIAKANEIAAASSLFGYSTAWGPGNVDVTWTVDDPSFSCPPTGNQEVAFVHIGINHDVPIFFPFLPISGHLTTEAEFRMEPVAK